MTRIPSTRSDAPRAVVIGSGFGGLAAAVRLRAKGYKVCLCEATAQLGGRASVFKREGFTFDAGPTVITAPYLIDELFACLQADPQEYYERVAVDPFYRVVFADGSKFDYVSDQDRLLANIKSLNPRDVDGYLRLAKHAEKIFDVGYTLLADKPFLQLRDMIRVLPKMIELENYRSVYNLVSKYISDERLRQVFTFEPLLVGGNPFQITSIYLLIHWLERKWGVHYIKGGTTALVQAFGRLLAQNEVEIRLNSAVERIEVVNAKAQAVYTSDGQRLACDLVVSNADPVQVYGKMISAANRPHHSDRSLARKSASMGLFVSYFGVKKQYPQLAHHTILLGARYRELLDDIFNRKVLASDFSLYLHAPTRTDARMAPDGCECFYVLSPVPNNLSKIDWEKEGELYQEKILDWLDKNHLPGLKENLVTKFFVTPDYFEKTLRTPHGSGFGLEPSLTQSAYFRFHNRSEDVSNLYFVGASTHPGAGVPGVLSSAKILDRLVPDMSKLSSATEIKSRSERKLFGSEASL